MQLRTLSITDLRCLRAVEMELSPSLNVIAGPNGSGKTSVLEGIYVLGLGRSFRGRSPREIIRRGAERLRVFGKVMDERGQVETIGVERGRLGQRIRVSGQEVRAASALAKALPILVITPESQRLLTDGARLRRRMLDWALFHVEPRYHERLQRYRQALRQRNAELRGARDARALSAWEREVGELGEEVHADRSEYVRCVRDAAQALMGKLLGRAVALHYQPGWDTGRPLARVLADTMERDTGRGYTGAGPHRADIRFEVEGMPAQQVLSRGEGKLFVAALLLAQTLYVAEQGQRMPLVLVDDLASELDETNRARVLEALRGCRAQIYLTAVSFELVDVTAWTEKKMFHVERGGVREMV